METTEKIQMHYNKIWDNGPNVLTFKKGPTQLLHKDFTILEYPPNSAREMWTYATCGMGGGKNGGKDLELHIFSSKQDKGLVELLTAIAYYHKNTASLGLNHSVNFGRSWQDNSICTFGFISLPYLDGPNLENDSKDIDLNAIYFYWLIPITEAEMEFKTKYGNDQLEELFDSKPFDYLNPDRESLA